MGSLPRLKAKDRLRYRKGSTNESKNCRHCKNFVDFKELNEEVAPLYGRCKIMGVKESVRYRVRKDYTCDANLYWVSKSWWMTGTCKPKEAANIVSAEMEVKHDDAAQPVPVGNPGAPAL